jgi:PEP-CTERM motif
VFGTPVPFGSGGSSGPPTTVSGDVFGFLDGSAGVTLLLPEDFSPTKIMTGSVTFAGATFASLGIDAGTFVTTLSTLESLGTEFGTFDARPLGDTITVIATPVPEPGTYALMLAGLGVVGFMARRRQNQLKGAQA